MIFTTLTGVEIDTTNIKPEDFNIHDIASGLSKMTRYSGQTKAFYSVADHSVRVSEAVYEESKCPVMAMAALLHDASEAYICDIPAPFKELLPDYKKLEEVIMKNIAKRFDLYDGLFSSFKYDDLKDRQLETRFQNTSLQSYHYESSNQLFLNVFTKYMSERNLKGI